MSSAVPTLGPRAKDLVGARFDEHLFYMQGVGGSSPSPPTIRRLCCAFRCSSQKIRVYSHMMSRDAGERKLVNGEGARSGQALGGVAA
jgi:hypothetical protein